jgi:hypothetical protein
MAFGTLRNIVMVEITRGIKYEGDRTRLDNGLDSRLTAT